jgi:hypothetical protein
MQEDVGQERTDARSLRRSPVRLVPLIALEDTGLEPHPDEPEHARVGNPVGQHAQQPLVVNRVERTHHRLPITKGFKSRPSSHASGIPLKDADFP